MDSKYSSILDKIRESKKLDESLENELKKGIEGLLKINLAGIKGAKKWG